MGRGCEDANGGGGGGALAGPRPLGDATVREGQSYSGGVKLACIMCGSNKRLRPPHHNRVPHK